MSKRKRDRSGLDSDAADGENGARAEGGVAPRADPADAVANRKLAGLIEDAVDELPLEFRTVFVLRAIQQLSVEETAESIGIPQATVKTRFHRARKLLLSTAAETPLGCCGSDRIRVCGEALR